MKNPSLGIARKYVLTRVLASLLGTILGVLAMTLATDLAGAVTANGQTPFFLGPFGHLYWRFTQSVASIVQIWGFSSASIVVCLMPAVGGHRLRLCILLTLAALLETWRVYGAFQFDGDWFPLYFSAYGLIAGLLTYEFVLRIPTWFERSGSFLRTIATSQFSWNDLMDRFSAKSSRVK